jgi:uncharacterized protein (TIGR03382 family)
MIKRGLRLGLLLGATSAQAHGIGGHVHVTGWAIEHLTASPLAAFLAEPATKNAALIGAGFPDSGYAVGDGYGEMAHWEPFVEAHIQWVRTHYGPDYDTPEARQQVGFLMGGAAHGLQDELFDSVFLYQISEHDGGSQDEADPGTDGFLAVDGHLRFRPDLWVPADDLVQLFEAQGHGVEAGTIRRGMSLVRAYILGLPVIGVQLDADYRPLIPWTAEHYLDPTIPGSLAAEVPATAAYMEALWARLHGEFPVAGLATHAWPHQRRLRSRQPDTVDGWITVIFGAGALVGSLTGDTVQLLDPAGEPVPIRVAHTRWGGSPTDSTRLVRIQPRAALSPDTTYTVRLAPGIELISGEVLDAPWTMLVRTPCDDPSADGCQDAEPEAFPPPAPDMGVDAEPDAALADAALADAALADATVPDAQPTTDAQPADAQTDAGLTPDLGPLSTQPGEGCQSAPAPGPWALLLLAVGGVLWRRRA